jgi:hypothetical protein
MNLTTGSTLKRLGEYRGAIFAHFGPDRVRVWECLHEHAVKADAFRCARAAHEIAKTYGTCPARLAYRSMADIGGTARCGRALKAGREFCGIHDPEFGPKRDATGSFVKKEAK